MTHDPANTWCAGRARRGDPSSVCELRTGCAHWLALTDHGRAHQGAPVPEGIAVRWRLCRSDRHEAYRPREATPEPVSEAGEADRLRVRIAALEHALRVYIHAHRSGNNVPVVIERDALKLLEAP